MKREPSVIAAALAANINALVLLLTGRELDPVAQAAVITVVTLVAGAAIRQRDTPFNRRSAGAP